MTALNIGVNVKTTLFTAPIILNMSWTAVVVTAPRSDSWQDGGYVVWVSDACGKLLGSHHAYWVWVIYVVDASIYPVLVANYVDTMVPMGATNRGLLSVGIVLAVTAINLLGTDVMVKFNTLLAILSLLPTLVFTVYGLPELKPTRLIQARAPLRPAAAARGHGRPCAPDEAANR